MNFGHQLRKNITNESVAYGYTLAVWGSGALLLNSFQTSPADILSFVIGGVTGFALLSIIAFKGLVTHVDIDEDNDYVPASMIHILASLGTVIANYTIITQLPQPSKILLFLIVGVNTTFLYNLMLVAESYVTNNLLR